MGWLGNFQTRHRKKLFSIVQEADDGITTGEIYDTYADWCGDKKSDAYSQRHVQNILNGWVENDIIDGEIINRGRGGRTTIFYGRDDVNCLPASVLKMSEGGGGNPKFLNKENRE